MRQRQRDCGFGPVLSCCSRPTIFFFLLALFTHLHWRKTHVASACVCVCETRFRMQNAQCVCFLPFFLLSLFFFWVFKFSFLCQTPALRSFISLSDVAWIKSQLNVHWTLADLYQLPSDSPSMQLSLSLSLPRSLSLAARHCLCQNCHAFWESQEFKTKS